jgi:uncharacterized protein (DUF4415 family)
MLINAGIASDPDTFVPTDEQFTQFTSLKLGRPFSGQTKQKVSIRLSAEIVEAFRSTGQGWQTRIDAALRQYLSEHPL